MILLLACVEPPPVEESASPPPDTAFVLSVPHLSPEIALEDLDAEVAIAMERGSAFPLTFMDVWVAVVEDGKGGNDPQCGGGFEESEVNQGHRTSNCLSVDAREGTLFRTRGGWMSDLGEFDLEDGSRVLQTQILYSFEAQRIADGSVVSGGGHFNSEWCFMEGAVLFTSKFEGSYRDTGRTDAFSAGVGVGATWQGGWADGGGFKATFQGPTGAGQYFLDLRDLEMDREQGPGARGRILMRDPGGGWWDITLNDDFSGCGTAAFDGEEMGESCAGLSIVAPLEALFRRGLQSRL